MRVLIIGGSLPPELRNGHNRTDGYSKAVWNITENLAKNYIESEFYYLPYHLTDKIEMNNLKIAAVKTKNIFLNFYRIFSNRKMYLYINSYINRNRKINCLLKNILIESSILKLRDLNNFDIIHVHGVVPEFFSYFSLFKKINVPILLTLHGIYSHDDNIKTFFNKKFEFDACKKYLDIGSFISTVSELTSRELEEYLNLKKKTVHSIENSIDIRYFEKKKDDFYEKKFKEKYGIKKNDLVALSVGTISKSKNQEAFINTLIKTKKENIHYIIIGQGLEKEKLIELVKENNLDKRVHLIGIKETSELIDIYDLSDFFVHLPTSEGFGLVYAEALSRGKPILTFAKLPFPKRFLNTINSVLVNYCDIESLTSATEEMIKKIKTNFFDVKEITNISKKFHPEIMATNYYDLYNEIKGRKNENIGN